ncbi:Uncharacterised protein [BD1-7 clade bacterium]|uniref:Uncharacterized protein n=1 Tax=BD1-7 clade bacterium TaxID=2029982 RepID=A0A5S9QRX9_9GAMM|nr:Uncharacterised protein [BD1-7 clade bacterium]CAA0121824.1 Uncharacterised protein [BD1-7 clade bacterium]
MTLKDSLEKSYKELQQERDELRVQMHLASMDAKDSWDDLEHKWDALSLKLANAGDAASQASQEIETAIDMLAEEIKNGYKRIRDSLH